jgi:adenylate cyclase
MSHELRTPLNAIIGLTEMMVTNAARFGAENALEPLRRVNAAGKHLLDLINEVLDLSKIEAGKLELNVEAVDLARLIDEVIGTAGQLAEKNQNRLILEAQETTGALAADSMRLKQILLSLLSNACKFTKDGDCRIELVWHGVLLVFGAPCQLPLLAGPEHGRTIPLATMSRPLLPRGTA